MVKKWKKIFLVLFVALGVGISIPKSADAGSYYYDKASGNYVIDAEQTRTGKSLNTFGAKFPGSVDNKFRKAVIAKYGSISEKYKYKIKYKNVVRPYGKYGGSSMTGSVVGVKAVSKTKI